MLSLAVSLTAFFESSAINIMIHCSHWFWALYSSSWPATLCQWRLQAPYHPLYSNLYYVATEWHTISLESIEYPTYKYTRQEIYSSTSFRDEHFKREPRPCANGATSLWFILYWLMNQNPHIPGCSYLLSLELQLGFEVVNQHHSGPDHRSRRFLS